ncbi:MAG: helix-turn-helix transcriptional regulator [Fibrobacter sp.]|nr:helix-turn-helix transcriptional regulator [Fibrobacter sp.]
MPLQNNIGPTIRALRAQRNVSQEKLALETGIGRRYMSDIENGRRNVSLETIEKLAGFFEISASELVRRIEQADMPPLTIDSLKDFLCELGHEDAVVLESPDYLSAVAGVSEDGRVIYSYPRMLEHLVLNDGMTYEEAAEFIDYNTIGSLPCMGEKAPIILNEIVR